MSSPTVRATWPNVIDLLRRWPLLAVLPVMVAAIWVTVAPPYTNSPPIRSDGLGYYAWNDAALELNFDFCEWSGWLDPVQALTAHNSEHPNRCEIRYTPGLALLRFPVMGPIAAISGGAGTLSVSNAEEQASLWLGVTALVVTVLLMDLTMRRLGAGPLVADLATLLACFGTGLFHYGTYDSSFTHIYDAALFASLLFTAVSAAQRGRRPNLWLVFILSLFIALVREPNIPVLLAMTAIWIIWRTKSLPRDERLREAVTASIPAGSAVIITEGFQLLYNHWASNRWTFSSYDPGQRLSLTEFAQTHVLLAYDHGLLLWYPVMAVLLFVALFKRPSRRWGYVGLLALGTLIVVYGSWKQWDLGGAFGPRGMVDVVPLVAVPGALGIEALGRRGRLLIFGISAACVFVTLELMVGYWAGTLPIQGVSGHEYWLYVVGSRSLF